MTRPELFWRSLAVYVLVGPIVGGWIVLGGMMIWIAASGGSFKISSDLPSDVPHVLFRLISFLPRNYIFGLVPAVIGGVVVAMKDAYWGGARFAFVLATGLGLALLAIALGWLLSAAYLGAILAAVCVLSSLACWWLTRRMVAGSGVAT